MFTGYYENKANRGREIRRVYTFKKDLCGVYSDTRTETLNQKTTDKPIGRINSGMKKLSYMYIAEGMINIYFGEPKPIENINEAFDVVVKKKNKSVNIYIRHKSEGRGSSINHAAYIKARAVDDKGKEYGPEVPYIIPDGDKYKECVIIDKQNKYSKFDSEFGTQIRAFVNHSQEGLNEYWYTDDTNELDKIQSKIRDKI